MRNLRGKKALVTGAASGIGRAIALRLARAGVDLFLLDIDDPALEVVADECRQAGVDVVARHCDVADSVQISEAVGALLGRWAGADILVNNAGVGYYGPTVNMSAEQWDRLLSINLHAPIQFTRELLPTLLSRPRAHVVNVSSMCGYFGAGRLAAYCTSKFAIAGFSEALRCEYGRQGLGVTAVCPGFVWTDFFRSTRCESTDQQAPVPPKWICTSADHVARKVMAAIRHDRRLVLATPLGYAAYYLKRFAPGLIDRLQRIGRRGKIKRKAAQLALAAESRRAEQTRRAA